MSLTRHRTIQYIGILFSLMLIAVGYWYFSVRAGVKQNTAALSAPGYDTLALGLAGYWKFDDGSGGTASDSSTNGNNGTLTNGPTWTTGQIGGAVTFDGSNDYINVSNSEPVFGSSRITMSAWVKIGSAPTNNGNIAERGGNSGYRFRIDNSQTVTFLDAGGYSTLTTTATVPLSTWTHITVTGSPSGHKIYLNGVLSASNATSYSAPGSGNNFHIGADVPDGEYFNGSIDEFRVYSRELHSDEISQLYRLTTPTSVDTSLKGYWSFNGSDISGTTAYDRSGAGNTGTLTNGPEITEGRISQALSFDGTDYVTATDSASLSASTAMSVSFWTKITGDIAASAKPLVFKTASGQRSWALRSYTNGGVQFLVASSNGDSGDNYGISQGAVLKRNEWAQVTAVYDGSQSTNATRAKIYINGIEQPVTFTGTIPATLTDTAAAFTIGGQFPDGGSYFPGSLDEVRFYNRALTASEIKAQFEAGDPDKGNTSAGQKQGTGNLDSGLAGYWRFDDASGTTATDSSTNGNNGTLTNGPTWTTGQIGGALDFDGSNDRVTVAAGTGIIDAQRDVTLSAWINPQSEIYRGIIYKGDPACSEGSAKYMLELNSYFVFYMGGSSISTGPANISPTLNQWQHVVATNSVAGSAIYVNGVRVASGATLPTPSSSSQDWWLSGCNSFSGKLDEVRIYNRALSADEVSQLYRLTTPTDVDTSLRGYWSFNGQDISGTSAYDRSGVGNTGTLTGGPGVVEGRVGQALSFDNVDDYVIAGSPAAVDNLETQGGGGMTASAWIYPESGGTFGGVIVGKRAPPSPGDGDWAFTIHQDGDALKFYKSYSTTSLEAVTASGSIVLNKWQFVTATWSGTAARSSVTFYIDGVLVPTSTSGGSDGVGTKDSDASASVSISSQFVQFDGRIDEVRLYNRILPAAEIKSLYDQSTPDKTNTSAAQKQGTGNLDSGLAGYWKLDENTGTSAADASTNGNTGTLTNMENGDWVTGRIGNGLSFDGTNEYIDLGTPSALTVGPGAFTISAWAAMPNGHTAVANTSYYILSKDNETSGGTSYAIYLRTPTASTTVAGFLTWDGATQDLLSPSTPEFTNDGSLHLVTGTWDGATKRLYLDGTLIATSTIGAQAGTAAVRIGGRASGTVPFLGTIDEPRVYNRSLSADEVTQLYRLGTPTGTETGLRGYWSFNGQDMSGTTAYDRSGAGNNGTLTSGPAITEGKVGQALSFDGTNDYVGMGDINTLDGLTAITASAWVKTTSFSTERQIIAKSGCVGGTNGGVFELFGPVSNGEPQFAIYKNGGSPDYYIAPSSIRIDDGNWHLATGTYDGSTVRIYVDGVQTGSTPASSVTLPSTGSSVYVGRCDSGAYWNGSIDEPRVYNRALSASEIKALYSSGR